MTAAPPNVIERYIGDDWTIGPIVLTDAGAAANLTGSTVTAILYAREQIGPVATLTETAVPGVGGLLVASDRTTGVVTEAWMDRAITAAIKPQDRRDASFPTRLAIVVADSRGRERTWLMVLFRPLDRRSDVPCAGSAS